MSPVGQLFSLPTHRIPMGLNGMVNTSALRWSECQAYFFSHRTYEEGPGEEWEPHPLGRFGSSEHRDEEVLNDCGPSWSKVFLGSLPTRWG